MRNTESVFWLVWGRKSVHEKLKRKAKGILSKEGSDRYGNRKNHRG